MGHRTAAAGGGCPMGVSGGHAVEELRSTGAQKKGEVARGSVGLRDKPFLPKGIKPGVFHC